MTMQRRDLLALPLALAAAPVLAQGAGPLPVELFFRPQQLTQAELNPAGTHAAMLIGGDAQKRRLVVVELATLKPRVLLSLDTTDVMGLHWVNDSRLLVRDGVEDTNNEDWRRTQLYAIDLDGENFRRLGEASRWVDQRLELGDEVLLFRPTDNSQGWGFLELTRLNTRTGTRKAVELPPWSVGFQLDAQGEPAAAVTLRDGTVALLAHQPEGGWKRLREVDAFGGDVFSLHGLEADGSWWVAARNGRDTRALYKLDPRTNQLAEKPQLALAGFDLDPMLQQREGKLLGVELTADARTTVWFDPDMKAVQAKIDAKLPATQNLLRLPARSASPWLLVWAFSDKRPARLLAYQRETDTLTLLGSTRPQIEPAQMAGMDYTPYKARDGRTIPAYLTLPNAASGAKKPHPLVVLVHGGPWMRGQAWGWEAELQFLASRGYAVLQPEFRGSDGFGHAHLQAGARQWGLAMQDDLADGVAWAVKEGHADPKRVAILGGSYGGYAAMMGLVRHPELFRCAVNYVGVTDIELLFSAHWSDVPAVAKRLGMARLIGDPKADAELLKANSPVHQAARIRQPVLMAYGRWDQRVPIEHGERMRDALKAHNPNVEWVLYDKEGHGWVRLDTQVDFWTRVERFLARHLA